MGELYRIKPLVWDNAACVGVECYPIGFKLLAYRGFDGRVRCEVYTIRRGFTGLEAVDYAESIDKAKQLAESHYINLLKEGLEEVGDG